MNSRLNVDGNSKMNSGMNVDGNSKMNSGMNVDGNSKMNSGMNVDGNSKMNSGMNVDGISGLPANIIDSILSRLTILEAMRTSILSRSWRYQWHYLSKISIEHKDLVTVPVVEHVKIVDHALLVHCGSIEEFKLNIISVTDYDINRWVPYLSRHSIKELIINNDYGVPYNLPYCIFSCCSLTKLELACCAVRPPTVEIKTFDKLRKLTLDRVRIASMTLEILINSCPHLRVLHLNEVRLSSSVKINAPNLWVFGISGLYRRFQLKNLPHLASFALESPKSSRIGVSKDCKLVELLGSMPTLRKLTLSKFALQHLAVGDVPARLAFVCPVKCLRVCINFEDLQELLAAFCIFRSSPSIRHLELRVFGGKNTARFPAYGFWEGEHDFNFRFDHLQEVWVTSFTGIETEVKFIKFLLANAPALKTVKIDVSARKAVKDVFATITKLVQFHCISPNAEFILPACC